MFNNDLKIPDTDLQSDNSLSPSETKTSTKKLHPDNDLFSSDSLRNIRPTKKMVDLEGVLDRLDNNLDRVLAQMEAVKKSRDELFEHSRKLQQNLELSGGEPDLNDERAKKLETMTSEIKKREDIVRELEKKEKMLSHSMLMIINNWTEELESNLDYYKKDTTKTQEATEKCKNKESN